MVFIRGIETNDTGQKHLSAVSFRHKNLNIHFLYMQWKTFFSVPLSKLGAKMSPSHVPFTLSYPTLVEFPLFIGSTKKYSGIVSVETLLLCKKTSCECIFSAGQWCLYWIVSQNMMRMHEGEKEISYLRLLSILLNAFNRSNTCDCFLSAHLLLSFRLI